MTPETIFKTMQDLIAEQFAIDADEVTMDSSFVDDLGADSVDLVELVMAMEEEFDIGEIDEDDLSWSAPNQTGDATLPLRWLSPATLLWTCHLGTPCVASCSQPISFIKYNANGKLT